MDAAGAEVPAHPIGRIIPGVRRQIAGDAALKSRFGPLLDLALKVSLQNHRQRGRKVYSPHAPEVECIGKGKAHVPYEFGCKVSVATPVTQPEGGQFVLHAKALHGNPFDGHTLGPMVADMGKLTGVEAHRIHVESIRAIAGAVIRTSSGSGSRARPHYRGLEARDEATRSRHRSHQGRAPHGPNHLKDG